MKKTLLLLTLISLTNLVFAQVPTSGLIAKYYFNSGNTNDDISTHNATNYGSTLTTDRFGNTNAAYSLDGNDYMKVPYYSTLNVSTGLTISVWIKQSSNVGQQALVSRWRNVKSQDQYLLMMSGASPMVAIGNPTYSANGFGCVNASVPTGQWNHLVMEWKNNGDHKLFVNGVRTDSTRLTAFATINAGTANDLYFGAQLVNSMDRYFIGSIDDVRIYNRVLTYSEVSALYNEVDFTTGINSIEASGVSVFPNPTSNSLTVDLADLQNASVKLFSIGGELLQVKNGLNGIQQFDVSMLSSGVYFAEVLANETVNRIKFVVQ